MFTELVKTIISKYDEYLCENNNIQVKPKTKDEWNDILNLIINNSVPVIPKEDVKKPAAVAKKAKKNVENNSPAENTAAAVVKRKKIEHIPFEEALDHLLNCNEHTESVYTYCMWGNNRNKTVCSEKDGEIKLPAEGGIPLCAKCIEKKPLTNPFYKFVKDECGKKKKAAAAEDESSPPKGDECGGKKKKAAAAECGGKKKKADGDDEASPSPKKGGDDMVVFKLRKGYENVDPEDSQEIAPLSPY